MSAIMMTGQVLPRSIEVDGETLKAAYIGDEPRAGFPSLTRNGDGDITITFDAVYTDPYGVTAPFVIHGFHVTPIADQVVRPVAERVSDTELRVRIFDASGGPFVNARMSVSVY